MASLIDYRAHKLSQLSHALIHFLIRLFRLKKNAPKARLQSADNTRESKEILIQSIERKLQIKDNTPHFAHQQVRESFLLLIDFSSFGSLICSDVVVI